MTMLKAAEAGVLLGLSARSVYALAKAGKLAADADGAFDPANIEAYKRSCRVAATNPPMPPAPRPPMALAPIPPAPPPITWTILPQASKSELRRQRREAEAARKEARRALVGFHAGKRRAAKLRRTPPWSNLDAMRGIYAEARRLTAETGIQHHVDHVIPMQGELVSGLHVHTNLQILTGSENSKKRNRYDV